VGVQRDPGDDETLRAIARQTFAAAEIVAAYPAKLIHPHKKLVYALACPPARPHAGALAVTRWAAPPLAEISALLAAEASRAGAAPTTVVEAAERFFAYETAAPGGRETVWHMNFADARLFGYYGGPLLAQDELQVAEHPALASLRQAMDDSDVPYMAPLASEDGRRTPVLIRGIERRCRIATEPDAAAGRPDGLYGNRFSRAAADVVTRAVSILDPPTITNLIAMEAPGYGRGAYSRAQVEDVLCTTLTGFWAARLESAEAGAPDTVVHTGFWGCGAFGGNRTLMALLQVAAARTVGVGRLVFHTIDRAGTATLREAIETLDKLAGDADLDRLVGRVVDRRYVWGETDGN